MSDEFKAFCEDLQLLCTKHRVALRGRMFVWSQDQANVDDVRTHLVDKTPEERRTADAAERARWQFHYDEHFSLYRSEFSAREYANNKVQHEA